MFDDINRIRRDELASDVQKDLLSQDDHKKLDSLIIGIGGDTTFVHRLDFTVNTTDYTFDGSKNTEIVINTDTIGAATADHVHPAQANITGNAATASKFLIPINIGNASFDGSKNITLADIGAASSIHTHTGVYSPADHNHDGIYSIIDHHHDGVYAPAVYDKETSNYAPKEHDHVGVHAMMIHSHDDYSIKDHNHDTVYSNLEHNHDNAYAAKEHIHKYAGAGTEGGAAISANKWNTPIELKIGDTAKNIDGSSNITFTTADIGILSEISINNITIPISSFSNLIAEYSNEKIKASHIPDVIFDEASRIVAAKAGIKVSSEDGKLILSAYRLPVADLTIETLILVDII